MLPFRKGLTIKELKNIIENMEDDSQVVTLYFGEGYKAVAKVEEKNILGVGKCIDFVYDY